jgi:predicted PurR-regulated permease PerM
VRSQASETARSDLPRNEDGIEVIEEKAAVQQAAEDAEILQASIKAGTVAQIVVAVIAIIGIIYLLKLVLVTILVSILLAYLLEPPVNALMYLKIPRWLGALLVVSVALAIAVGLVYFSYNRALEFADELPHYSAALQDTVGKVRSHVDEIADRARSAVEPKEKRQPVPVKIQEAQGVTRMISENSGAILEVLMAIGFVPFLVYFMLASKEKSHIATVRLFPKEHRVAAHRTVGRISGMIRSYIVANVLVGLLNGAVCAAVFWFLGIPYFYFIGAISGFLSLIPYLGVFLALLPPLGGGVGALSKTGLLTVFVTVVGLHLVTMNLVYPKVIGERLQLNPLAVSLSLLFWAWIWGAPGLILAIPILGAGKIMCDHIDTLRGLGAWLGDSVDIGP